MDDEKQVKAYEISFLLPEEALLQSLLKHLSGYGAEILSEGGINKIRLAYTIKKYEEAYFGYLNFKMEPEKAAKLNDTLNLDSKIIRFLIVGVSPKRLVVRRVESERPTLSQPISQSEPTELTNDALEKKLEEILK